jgi:glucose/arabinose dehydrogenase
VRTLARGRWDGTALVEVRDLFSAIPSGNASRILFGRDGMIYMTIGIGDNEAMKAKDLNELANKMLRLQKRRDRAAG